MYKNFNNYKYRIGRARQGHNLVVHIWKSHLPKKNGNRKEEDNFWSIDKTQKARRFSIELGKVSSENYERNFWPNLKGKFDNFFWTENSLEEGIASPLDEFHCLPSTKDSFFCVWLEEEIFRRNLSIDVWQEQWISSMFEKNNRFHVFHFSFFVREEENWVTYLSQRMMESLALDRCVHGLVRLEAQPALC